LQGDSENATTSLRENQSQLKMIHLSTFAIISVFFVYVSRKSLVRPQSHGFYRFFVWESTLALVLLNEPHWFSNPFSPLQIISWLSLGISIFLVLYGVYLLRVFGRPDQNRADPELLKFEKTSSLVTVGIYKYIRHPLYSSLLFLTWGAFLKQPSGWGLFLASSTSLFLFLASKNEEKECLRHFGDAYQKYMQTTKMLIPFLL
jgi:protein-S-isoprenylcysteine O-methyltransferase Ste14